MSEERDAGRPRGLVGMARGPAVALALLAIAACPTPALPVAGAVLPGHCCIYFTTGFGGTVGRVPLRGYYPQTGFVRPPTPQAFGIATDPGHLYWGEDGQIGRAALSGAGPDERFIDGLGGRVPAVAVDASHIYWAEPGADRIARADLDGSSVDEDFIDAQFPAALAVDSAHIYWTTSGGSIGRANLDGTGVEPGFVTGADLPAGLAVDADHVYWTNFGADTIGRAAIDGTGVDQGFISATDPWGLAVDSSNLYWSNLSDGTIGRADLNGLVVEPDFVRNAGAFGVGIGPAGELGTPRAQRVQWHASGRIKVRIAIAAAQRLRAHARGSLAFDGPGSERLRLHQPKPLDRTVKPGAVGHLTLKPHGRRARRVAAAALERRATGIARLRVVLADAVANRTVTWLRLKVTPRCRRSPTQATARGRRRALVFTTARISTAQQVRCSAAAVVRGSDSA